MELRAWSLELGAWSFWFFQHKDHREHKEHEVLRKTFVDFVFFVPFVFNSQRRTVWYSQRRGAEARRTQRYSFACGAQHGGNGDEETRRFCHFLRVSHPPTPPCLRKQPCGEGGAGLSTPTAVKRGYATASPMLRTPQPQPLRTYC